MIKGKEITMNPYQIAESIKTWCNWPGFTAEQCHNDDCGVTINTLAGGPGYFCPRCDHYNVQSHSGFFIPHRNPDFGPTLETIRKGSKIAARYSRTAHKFYVGQKVWANKCSWPDRRTIVGEAYITKPGKDCYPCMIFYYVQFNDEKFERHIYGNNICARPRGSSSIRRILFWDKPWLVHITQVSIKEIAHALKEI